MDNGAFERDVHKVVHQYFLEYKHSSIYAVNVGTHKKRGKRKPHKSRLLSSTKGEENRIEL